MFSAKNQEIKSYHKLALLIILRDVMLKAVVGR